MQRRILQIVFALITAGCLWGVFASQAAKPEVTIKVAFLAGVNDEDNVGALAFKRYVEARSAGRVRVDVYPAGQFCGNERECIEGLGSGILEMHMTTIGGLAALLPEAQVIDIPYAFSGDAQARCVLDGPLVQDIRKAVIDRGYGMRLMAVGDTGGWRAFGSTAPVRKPEDLARLKIRTTPSALEQEMVRELGAFPTPLPFSEVYTALGYGMLDGVKNSPQDMVGQKFQEKIKYVLADRHAYMAALWWYSQTRWDALPDDLKPVVEAGMAELARVTRQAAADREQPAVEAFRAAGGEVHVPTPEERARFVEATGGVRTWFAQKYGREWLDRLDAAVARCS
jgi:tripartite ATP-independent transporter DctP family solute receptor